MATVKEIYAFLASLAPPRYAESYDNVGLLAGSERQPVTRAMIALDITRPVCEEAQQKQAELIISHHPVIFRPVSQVRRDGATAVLWELVSRELSAICMHTNLDIAPGGVNDVLVETLSLPKTGILKIMGRKICQKIVVFVPEGYEEPVRAAMASAGAGRLGAYDSCAFESKGTGYFRPLPGAQPFIGQTGEVTAVKETRIEAICLSDQLGAVIDAMTKAHPYETPAYDIFDDAAVSEPYGIGLYSDLPSAMALDEFAQQVCQRLDAGRVLVCRASGSVQRVALCSGSWDDELTLIAKETGADTIVTGEIKHSAMLLALTLGLNVVAAGHFATENVVCPALAEKLSQAFPDIVFEVAHSNHNPAYFV